jgi:hypothetical protein
LLLITIIAKPYGHNFIVEIISKKTMARLTPNDIDEALALTKGKSGELATLKILKEGLRDEFVIYHSVHWAQAESSGSAYGEIDFIIANKYGKLLAIEQKDGVVYVDNNDLKIDYASGLKGKSVTTQITRNLNAMREQFSRRHPNKYLSVDHLLYVPNVLISSVLPIGVDPKRVVDHSQAQNLCQIIEALFDEAPMPAGDQIADPNDIHDFLSDRVHAQPHIGLLGKSAREFSSRISEGLATWAGRLTIAPFRLRVQGTAGSGKTQLALQELRLAHSQGQQALYLCYNRPLADAIKKSAPASSVVATIHEFGKELGLNTGQHFDFKDPKVFDQMIQAIHDLAPKIGELFDVLVVDEAQDMSADWVDALLPLVKVNGRMTVLEDPEQSLYDRPQFCPDKWALLQSPVNYRSPRLLVDFMNHLELTAIPIKPGGGILGFNPGWHYYDDHVSLVDETEAALNDLIKKGYKPDTIAILTWQAANNSKFLNNVELRGLGGLALKYQNGYDDKGSLTYTNGQILVDTIRRFKGQSADAVIITEIDFDTLSQHNKRKLFVALSRARLHAVLVTSAQARDVLIGQMNEE